MAISLRPRPAQGITLLIRATRGLQVVKNQHILINIQDLHAPSPTVAVIGHRPTVRAVKKEHFLPEKVKTGFRIVGVFGGRRVSGKEDDFAVDYEGLNEDERKSREEQREIRELKRKQKELDRRESEAVKTLKRKAKAIRGTLDDEMPTKKSRVDGVEKSEEESVKSKDSSRRKKTTKKTTKSSSTRPRQAKAPPKQDVMVSNYATRSKGNLDVESTRSKGVESESDPDAEWNAAIEADLAAWKPKPNCRKGENVQQNTSMPKMMASLGRYNAFKEPSAYTIVTSFPEKKMDPEAVVAFITLFGSPISKNWRQFIDETSAGWFVKNTKAVEKWARDTAEIAPERVKSLQEFMEKGEPYVSEYRRQGIKFRTL